VAPDLFVMVGAARRTYGHHGRSRDPRSAIQARTRLADKGTPGATRGRKANGTGQPGQLAGLPTPRGGR